MEINDLSIRIYLEFAGACIALHLEHGTFFCLKNREPVLDIAERTRDF